MYFVGWGKNITFALKFRVFYYLNVNYQLIWYTFQDNLLRRGG